MARWLLDEGAGAVVLNGRRAPEGPAGQEIERLREGGAEVRVQLADVADPEAVTCLVGGIGPASGIPPLGGVVHSAGVLSDAALAYQDWPGFERVLRPKVMGAWNLHRATLGSAPDLFVVFSSVAGLLGSPGQANYAAANAFLDQLARHRRALGLAGQAIQWGAWSDVGVAADRRERLADRLAAAGVEWITPDQGLRALGRLVRDDVVSAAVTAVDWGTFGASVESCPRLFSELVEDVRRGPEQAAADSLAVFFGRFRRFRLIEVRMNLDIEIVGPAVATGVEEPGIDRSREGVGPILVHGPAPPGLAGRLDRAGGGIGRCDDARSNPWGRPCV